MSFGEKLIALRKERKISRKELAEILGIPYTTLRNYETDQREAGHQFLKNVASFFNVTIDFLLDMDKFREKQTIRENIQNKNENISPLAFAVAKQFERASSKEKNMILMILDLESLKEILQKELTTTELEEEYKKKTLHSVHETSSTVLPTTKETNENTNKNEAI